MYKKFGKHINTNKLQKGNPLKGKPSNQASGLPMRLTKKIKQLTNDIINPKRYSTYLLPSFPTDGSTTSNLIREPRDNNKDLSNPFYNYLMKNCITRISTTLKSATTGTTSISILAPGVDYLLRKGDTFYLYNRKSFKSMELTADANLMSTDTSITITATNFKRSDYYMAGSFIIANNQTIIERASNAPEFKRFDLTNAEYKALQSSPFILLAAETGKLHIPLNATILYNHGANEMTRSNLFIGYNSLSTTIGNYWASINNAFYRNISNMIFQLSPGIYGAGSSSDHSVIAMKDSTSNSVGDALYLYGNVNFTSPSSTITVLLYYKTIVI